MCLRMDVDPNLQWDFIGELGDGAFGKVYKVSHPKFSYLNDTWEII